MSDIEFEINGDEAELKFGLERHHGSIRYPNGESPYSWDLGRTNHPQPDNINGGYIAELNVWTGGGVPDLMDYQNGAWIIKPDGELAQSILAALLKDYDGE